jgi:hypothetical protein
MALTWGDDYPIHQTPSRWPMPARIGISTTAISSTATRRRGTVGDAMFFAAAFGVYPHLNIADAAFCVMKDGRQVNLHASRWLEMERMDLASGRSASRCWSRCSA